jgi:hypothetical protein
VTPGQGCKGSTIRTTLEFVGRVAGPEVRERALARLRPEQRRRVESVEATGVEAFELLLALWHAVDTELGADDPGWIERSGAYAIESVGVRLYGGILRKSSPEEFLTQAVSLFTLFYHPGDMEVVEHARDRAILRLVGFDGMDRLFCRRLTGGLERSLVIAGGAEPRVRHVRCGLDGDQFCEWELGWR